MRDFIPINANGEKNVSNLEKIDESKKAAIAFLKRVDSEKPSKKDLDRLERHLADIPDLWRVAGDLTKLNQNTLIDQAGGHSKLVRASLEKGCEVQRAELGYEQAPALEKLLIEHVVLCWLRWTLVENHYTGALQGSTSINEADYWERKLSASQRRYLRAAETLARVRKLARTTPILQVNIATEGGQQVNVSGS